MKLLVHVESHDVVGILPSQLESLGLLCTAMGVSEKAYIDHTPDGVRRASGWTRFGNIADFLARHGNEPLCVFDPVDGTDIRDMLFEYGTWMVFGPAMGWRADDFEDRAVNWAKIPGGVLCSRDVVPIALWETSAWQAP